MPPYDLPSLRPQPSLDPLADLVLLAHNVSIDCLVEALRMRDAVRALWFRDELEAAIRTLQAASNASAERADLILRHGHG